MIMLKDKILANQFKKYKIKDYFNTEDEVDPEKTMMDYGEDIFSLTYKRKNERKQRFKNVCAFQKEETMSDEYKYHQIHHKGLGQLRQSQNNLKRLYWFAPLVFYNQLYE